ncbi:50S ribosomal protein L1 [Buchnera aphidicola]|uniref:50S ribosomal protein L1 n=1 Tax=Buchnera aphidicola TaxID=9 RepID=UPI0031B83914
MTKYIKKKKNKNQTINIQKEYNFHQAINILRKNQNKKFIESVDIAINLNIDAKQSSQNIKGITILPHGIGKKMKIAVLTQGDNIQKAIKYGAYIAGGEEIINQLKDKKNNFNTIIASPDMMNLITKLGPILGPRGLLPNPKTGTVTNNIKETVKNFYQGHVRYKNEKNGIIHTTIGKINFSNEQLQKNLIAIIIDLNKLKPKNIKGDLIKKITLSTTMGVGIKTEINSIYENTKFI